MKYLTMEWHQSYQDFDAEVNEQPLADYKRYYRSVKRRLPAKFVAFAKKHDLHDADLQSLKYNVEKQRIKMGWMMAVPEGQWIMGHEVELIYSAVANLTISRPSHQDALSDADLQFLLFNEIELLDDKMFEHRMLFHSGIEISIIFKSFQFKLN